MSETGFTVITDKMREDFIILCVVPVWRRDIIVQNAELRAAFQKYLHRFEGRRDYGITNTAARLLYNRIREKHFGLIKEQTSSAQHVGMVLLPVPEEGEEWRMR